MSEHKPAKLEYIDVLRGLAIVGVVAVHSEEALPDWALLPALRGLFHYGQLGVQLFFVASAITLCLSTAARHETGFLPFFIRRWFRIAPMYFLAMPLYFCWRVVLPRLHHGAWVLPPGYNAVGLAENLLFVHGFDWRNFNYLVPGGWSISTEFQFYLLFPFIWRLASRSSARRLGAVAGGTLLAAFLLQWALAHGLAAAAGLPAFENHEWGYWYCLLPNQMGVFLIGVVAWRCLGRPVPRWLGLLAMCAAGVSAWMLNDHGHDTGFDGLFYASLSALAFAVLAVGLSRGGHAGAGWMRLLAELGRKSYSLYLVHWLVLEMVRYQLFDRLPLLRQVPDTAALLLLAGVLALSYGLAALTGRWVERPFMRLGSQLARAVSARRALMRAGPGLAGSVQRN